MIVAPMFVWSVMLTQVFVIASFILLPIQLAYLNRVFRQFRQLADLNDGVLLFGELNGILIVQGCNVIFSKLCDTYHLYLFYSTCNV